MNIDVSYKFEDVIYSATNHKIIVNIGEATRIKVWDFMWDINKWEIDDTVDVFLHLTL